jgi:hypothetical protein
MEAAMTANLFFGTVLLVLALLFIFVFADEICGLNGGDPPEPEPGQSDAERHLARHFPHLNLEVSGCNRDGWSARRPGDTTWYWAMSRGTAIAGALARARPSHCEGGIILPDSKLRHDRLTIQRGGTERRV